MTNFCWDNMIDYPARSVNYTSHTNHPGGQVFQVFDEDRYFSTKFRNSEIDNFKIYFRHDDVKDLSVIKHFPYYLLLHSILVLWPMILWKKFYAVEAKRKLDFLISGMEEGITSIVAGLANDTTWDRDEESIKVYGHLIFVAEIILIFG